MKKNALKFAVIGGGSSYTPELIEGILNRKDHLPVRELWLVDVPIGIKKDIAKLLGVDAARVNVSFMGLNHMSYAYSVTLDGEEILPKLIEMYDQPDSALAEKLEAISDIVWPPPFLRSLGMLTSPYHRYYYRNRMMLEEEKESMAKNGSRAMQVKEIEKALFEKYADPSVREKPKELEKRGGAYYSEAAISLVDAIYNDKQEIHTVNVQNRGTITNLPYNAIIETNALIGAQGAAPLRIGEMPTRVAGLVNYVKAYEQLAVRAAVEKDYDIALSTMMANPFIDDYEVGKAILDELIEQHTPYLDYLKK
ncbi:MAG: hypothetical protein MR648_04730 [Clostridiales bacterium]|nr:hypothetical protein [Clostridiales bacterium]MDY4180036.1 hypothetical protein [Pseudoflavonifractor sp.]